MGVFIVRDLLFGVHIGTPDFWAFLDWDYTADGPNGLPLVGKQGSQQATSSKGSVQSTGILRKAGHLDC